MILDDISSGYFCVQHGSNVTMKSVDYPVRFALGRRSLLPRQRTDLRRALWRDRISHDFTSFWCLHGASRWCWRMFSWMLMDENWETGIAKPVYAGCSSCWYLPMPCDGLPDFSDPGTMGAHDFAGESIMDGGETCVLFSALLKLMVYHVVFHNYPL